MLAYSLPPIDPLLHTTVQRPKEVNFGGVSRGERSTESARARHAKRFTVETLIPLSDILRAASLDYDAN